MKKKYYVQVQVNYDGDIWAESEAEAEQLAWSSYYGDDPVLTYDSVEDIKVEEYDHCENCGVPEDDCDCCENCDKVYDECECENA